LSLILRTNTYKQMSLKKLLYGYIGTKYFVTSILQCPISAHSRHLLSMLAACLLPPLSRIPCQWHCRLSRLCLFLPLRSFSGFPPEASLAASRYISATISQTLSCSPPPALTNRGHTPLYPPETNCADHYRVWPSRASASVATCSRSRASRVSPVLIDLVHPSFRCAMRIPVWLHSTSPLAPQMTSGARLIVPDRMQVRRRNCSLPCSAVGLRLRLLFCSI
jgi:hypothetical protein